MHEFTTEAQAKAFIVDLANPVTEELRQLLDKARRQLDERTGRLSAEVIGAEEDKARALIKRAAARLSVAFDIKLQVPPPAVVNGKLAIDAPDPSVRTWYTQESYQTTERRRAWWKLWMGYYDAPVTRWTNVRHDSYQVSRADIATRLRDTFDQHVAAMSDGLDQYVAHEVNERLTRYYTDLGNYLESYHSALKRSQEMSRATEAERVARKGDLSALSSGVADEQGKLAGYAALAPLLGRPAGS
jgi:hypothetical protein